MPTVTLQGQRVYPSSLVAGDVARALERRVAELGVDVRYRTPVGGLSALDGFDAVIVATGGRSYPVTGSTGDGYRMAEEAGHTVTPTFPNETALLPRDYDRSLSGLTLKNVGLQLFVDRSCVQSEEGEFSFTDDGLESGIAYHMSRRSVWALMNGQRVDLVLDLKPALTEEQLVNRIERASELWRSSLSQKNARGSERHPLVPPVSTTLEVFSLLPKSLIAPFLRAHPGVTVAGLPAALKSWPFSIIDYKGFDRAVVTAGGVNLKEIVPKTMASRLRPGLFFCGEVLDLDGDTGGYNLQIAFSTGALAGVSAANYLLSLS